MIVPLKRNGDLNEWAIVELQGDLKFDSTSNANDQYIGDVHFTKTGIPIFIIGVHVLYGKEVSLSKPLAVLEKKSSPVEANAASDFANVKTEYIIKAIVRKKLIFKNRPKPIITNVPKCN